MVQQDQKEEENRESNQVEEKPEESEGASVGGGPEESILRLPFLQMNRTTRQSQQGTLDLHSN